MVFKKYIYFQKIFSKKTINNKKKLFFSQNLFKKNISKYFFNKNLKKYFSFYFFSFDFNKINIQKNYGILFKKRFKNNLIKINFLQFKNQKYIFYNFYINFLNFNF